VDISTANAILNQKEPPELYHLVQPALAQVDLRDLLVDGCFATDETYRYNCVRVFFRALEQKPAAFYSYWERFAEKIGHPNGFFRSTATQALAFLSVLDTNKRLDVILEAYLGLLDDEKIMVARYFTQTIYRVAQARPDLRSKIVACLLAVGRTRHNESRKGLLKADIIHALDELFEDLSEQEQKDALAFADNEQASESPSTRNAARAFLARHS
jgi:hypothetical protein